METKIKDFISKNRWRIVGIFLGLIGGFLYYQFVGCNSGTCPITSNPLISTLYGGVIGYLISDFFKIKEVKKEENEK
jgi:hypothetical protein